MDRSEIVKRFGKKTLLEVAEKLEIDLPESTHVFKVIGAIQQDIEENGVPESDDEIVSDEMYDLMVAMGYYTEDGDIADLEEGGDEEPEDEEVGGKPCACEEQQCWGSGDPEYDPACKACECSAVCWEERLNRRRSRKCFGTMYDPQNKDCSGCDEWRYCESAMPAG